MRRLRAYFAGGAVAAVVLVAAVARGQVEAKTDATAGPMTRPAMRLVGSIDHPAVAECSGIVASRRYPGVYWVHNDGGNANAIYAIDRKGKLIGEFAVAAENVDWEDIAIDDRGRIYIADVGNNERKRGQVLVHRIEEPDPRGKWEEAKRLAVEKTWRVEFPGEPFDCEAMFVMGEHGYVISKLFLAGRAQVYRFPLEGDGRPVVLERVCALPIYSPVTGADVSADGKRLAVLSVTGVSVFTIEGEVGKAEKQTPIFVRHVQANAEGVCFGGEGEVLVTTEAREVYGVSVGGGK